MVSLIVIFFSVSSMGNYNFGKASFTKQDVYGTIQSYLTTGISDVLTDFCLQFKT